MDLKNIIAENLSIEGVTSQEIYQALILQADTTNGDISLPCFKYSKILHKSPIDIANILKSQLLEKNLQIISDIKTINGYLNIYFDKQNIAANVIPNVLAKGEKWENLASNGKTITIDYSSINIAKPFHIGHLLTTVIGGSLYRIFKYLGYNVLGINHLGDWGTQFGKLITAYLKWGDDNDIQTRGVRGLLDLYVRFHKEAETNDDLNNQARMWFKKIEDGDEQALTIFKKFKDITLKEVGKVYDRLGVKFDSYNGESFYNDKMQPVVDRLKEKGLLSESEGAMVVDLSEYNMPPCLILKSDGASLYATRDLAAAIYRQENYHFDKNLYVVAYQQNLHFKQVFKVLELMGYDWAKDCVHVPFGMVSLAGSGALSTREGNVVFLSDVLDTSVNKALEIINEKNPNLENKQEVANEVGIGAVIFGALYSNRIKDMVFSYDKALSFEGETGPYLQYTHARCCSILNKVKSCGDEVDYSILTDDDSYAVVKLLNNYDSVVRDSARTYEPSIITRYLLDLAQAFNKFYMNNRIMGEEQKIVNTRLALTKCVQTTLKNGLDLILLKAPTKM